MGGAARPAGQQPDRGSAADQAAGTGADELGILDREIRRVKNGRVLLIPGSEDTAGHGTTAQAKFWKKELAELLQAAPGTVGAGSGLRAGGGRREAGRMSARRAPDQRRLLACSGQPVLSEKSSHIQAARW